MTANDAMTALKADNPRLKVASSTFKYEGFNDPLTVEALGVDMAPNGPAMVQQASERVQLLLTTAPSQEAVWAVSRQYTFPTSQRPSMQATVDALRKKYGPETVPAGPQSAAQNFLWVFDLQGKLIGGANGARLGSICDSTVGLYTWESAKTAINIDITGPSPRAWLPECESIILIYATVSGIQIAPNQFAATIMDVRLHDGGRYRKALAATRTVIQNAVAARQGKDVKKVDAVPPPKL
jgi:hypothetical protein